MVTLTRLFCCMLAWALPVGASLGQTIRYANVSLASGGNDGSTWANAFRGPLALQSALTAAQPGDSIWVAAGAYKPALPGAPVTSTFELKNNVSVYGGFAGTESVLSERSVASNPTILSGNLDGVGTGDVRHVVTATNLDATATIDGFTITLGKASGTTSSLDLVGGGILVNGGSPTIRNCTFEENMASRGAGLALVQAASLVENCTFGINASSRGAGAANLSSNGTFARCTFETDIPTTGGTAGAGIYSGRFASASPAPSLTVDDCTFSIVGGDFGCASGIAIHAELGHTVIRDSRFLNNFSCGSGAIEAQGIVDIDRCVFIGNEGMFDGGAAIHSFTGDVTVTNSLFAGNDRDGISTITAGARLTLINCTLAYNGNTLVNIASGGNHILIAKQNAEIIVKNCIIWGNQSRMGGASAVVSGSGTIKPRFDFSIVQNWGALPVAVEGTNSFAADPLFLFSPGPDGLAGTSDDDLHLSAASPAIDRGDNNAALSLLVDLDAQLRRRDDPATPDFTPGASPQIDIGAFEFIPACPGDLNADGLVDDGDFVLFAAAYNILDCADPAMPAGCPSDLNHDAGVDDADFVRFANAYNVLICP